MTINKILLRELPSSGLVEAELTDRLSIEDLHEAEIDWSPFRLRLISELSYQRINPEQWPESLHWNWAQKGSLLRRTGLFASGAVRLMGVRQGGQWQGLLYAISTHYFSRLSPGRRIPLVYVDFVEIAPWNWNIPSLKKTGQFRGIGLHLIGAASQWSMALGYAGRIGLHALPQATRFYTTQCGMTDLGPDDSYHDLHYFESPDAPVSGSKIENEQ